MIKRRISGIAVVLLVFCNIFFFNDTATTEIYTLSLHDALPISSWRSSRPSSSACSRCCIWPAPSRRRSTITDLHHRFPKPFQGGAVVRRTSLVTLLTWSIVSLPGIALAAEGGGTGGWVGPFAVLAAGLGMGLASGLCGLGQGRAAASAVDAIARQPGASRP